MMAAEGGAAAAIDPQLIADMEAMRDRIDEALQTARGKKRKGGR